MTDIATALSDWFDRNADEVVRTAQDLVRIPSVNPKFDPEAKPDGERAVQEYIAGRMAEVGLDTTIADALPGRPSLHTAVPEGTTTLAFNGHIDVVPEGDLATWTKDPFGAELDGGRLYGRGALDMKGGVACAMTAIRALRECGFDAADRLALHTVPDEEAGGFGTRALLERITAPTAAMVPEPSNEEIQITEGGLEWVRITIRGRNGHSAWRYADLHPHHEGDPLEEMNVNAIDLLADLVREIGRLEWKWAMTRRHPLLPPGFTTISPGVARAGSSIGDDGLPRLYDNPAMIPDVAVIDYDVKFFPGEEDTVRAELEECVANWAKQHPWLQEHPPTVEWELKGLWFPSMDTPEDDPIVTTTRSVAERLGQSATIAGFPAVADAAFYAHAGTSALIYGPKGAGLHGPDEYVEVASLDSVARALALVAVEYLGT